MSAYERNPDAFDVGLTLADDRVLMTVYDADRHLRALVVSDRPPFVEWASALFERYLDRSERVGR
jgi:predicted transcriptional regulator